MEIISSEEFELKVAPLFNKGLIKLVQIEEYSYRFISQRFDYLKVISDHNTYSSWFNIEPIELQQAIMNASYRMGDRLIYLSFVDYEVESNIPLNFKFPIQELFDKELYQIKEQAEKLIDRKFCDVLVYSPQGVWAILVTIDYYGTLGMTKDFLYLVRSIYPKLDKELDRQLFDFIRWCNDDPHTPDEWEYIPGDTTAYRGWCKVLMEYLCRINVSKKFKNLNDNIDLISIYRNLKV